METPVVKKFLVKKFIIEGDTLLPEANFRSVVSQTEEKELTLEDIKGVADLTRKMNTRNQVMINL